MNADQIVRDFCAAWDRGDVEAVLAAFDEDAVYHNIPMDPLEGIDAIRTFVSSFMGGMASEIHFDIRHQMTSENVVMNERVDTIVMGDRRVALPVCGVFELTSDGKIAAWRDYFDAAQFAGG